MERTERIKKLLALCDHIEDQCWTFSLIVKTEEEQGRIQNSLKVGANLLELRKSNNFTPIDHPLYEWHCQLADMAEKASDAEFILSYALNLISDSRDRIEGGDEPLAMELMLDASLHAGILLTLPSAKVSIRGIMSSLGRRGANMRHAETRSMREDAKQYWRENIDPKLSNDKAAEVLTKIVPLSHRKLSEIVSEARKEDGAVTRQSRSSGKM